MASFPLLKLPLLAQKKIILQMKLVIEDVIELTLLSTKLKKVIEKIKFDVHSFTYIIDDDESLGLFLTTNSKDYVIISSLFRDKTLGGSKKRTVDGESVFTDRGFKRISGMCEHDTDKSRMDLLELFTRHLLSFLRIEQFELQFKRNSGLKELFVWKYTFHFDKVEIEMCSMKAIQYVQMTSDDLKFILKDVSVDCLLLNVQISNDSNFKYNFQEQLVEPLKIRKIKITNLSWVDMDNILNANYKSITLQVDEVLIVRHLLKQWITGKNDELEKLVLLTPKEYTSEEVFEGIRATPTTFKKEELENRCCIWMVRRPIMDIQRENDYCLASVIISDDRVTMLVWNEKRL